MKKIPELRQPAIPGLVDGALDPDSAPNGAQVSVFYDDMLRDDQVELRWITSSSTASFVEARAVQADGTPLNFTVPYPVLDAGRGLTATVDYTAVRNNTARQSYAQTVPIRSTPAGWPPPRILDATGNDANPFNPIKPLTDSEENKATVIITDARLKPTDLLAVVWRSPGNAQQSVSATLSAGEARADIPRELIATSIAKTVSIAYVVWRDTDVIGAWEALVVTVLPIEASALPEPIITEAQGSKELDVTALTGNATVTVARWPFMTTDQVYWLEARGTLANNVSITFPLAEAAPVSSLGGITCSMELVKLKTLKDRSTLTLVMAVALGADINERTTFPLSTYNVHTLELLVPTIVQMTDAVGVVDNNATTPDAAVTVIGTATQGLEVELFDGAVSAGVVRVDAQGNWRVVRSNLAMGAHVFTAKARYGSEWVSTGYNITRRSKVELWWEFLDYTLQGWVPQGNYVGRVYVDDKYQGAPTGVGPVLFVAPSNAAYAGPIIARQIQVYKNRSYALTFFAAHPSNYGGGTQARVCFTVDGQQLGQYETIPVYNWGRVDAVYTATSTKIISLGLSHAPTGGSYTVFAISGIAVNEAP